MDMERLLGRGSLLTPNNMTNYQYSPTSNKTSQQPKVTKTEVTPSPGPMGSGGMTSESIT